MRAIGTRHRRRADIHHSLGRLSETFWLGVNRAVRLRQEQRARTHRTAPRSSHRSRATQGAAFTDHACAGDAMLLLLRWLLLPTLAYASNAWHTDEDCGCHNLNSAWGIRTMFERGYNASLAHRASDLKTLKEKSKQTKSEKKLRQALTYELWRSLRAYRSQQISTREAVWKSNVAAHLIPRPNHDLLHAIDATPARRRGGVVPHRSTEPPRPHRRREMHSRLTG